MTLPRDFVRGLVDRYGVSQRELTVLSSDHDPFLTGTPGDIEKAEWFASVYEQLDSPRWHLRDVHYAVVVRLLARLDGALYEGTLKDWRALLAASSKARELGLVSPFAFLDRRTRSVCTYDEQRDPRVPLMDSGMALLDRHELEPPEWDVVAPELKAAPTALSRQPVVLEVWVEKESAALEAEVQPVADEFGARLVTGVGYQSETAAADLVKRAIEDGRPRVLFWLADADAAGENMAVATARHVEFLCHWIEEHEPETFVPRIVIDRVALTLDQLAAVEAQFGRAIPLSPDARRAEGRVELQALAAFAPGWVGGELRRRLEQVTDPDLDGALAEWEADAEQRIEEAWEAETEAFAKRLGVLRSKRDAIVERFEPLLAELSAALDELEPERKKIEAGYEEIADGFNPELPPLPKGTVDLDQGDWLLDTERSYLDQLNVYRAQAPVHRRKPPLMLEERLCACGCGRSLIGRRAGARFFDDACRMRGHRAGGTV